MGGVAHAERVWIFNGVLLGLVGLLIATTIHDMPPLAKPQLAWWLIALAFAAAERCVVHLHFGGGAHSFSLADVPLVFGLIFVSGVGVVAAWMIGSVLMLSLDRRLPPVKLVFNVAQFGLGACVAVIVSHAIAPASGHVVMSTWLGVLLATQASGLVTVLLIAGVLSLSEGLVSRATVGRMLAMDAVVTLSNASLGVCGVMMTVADPRTLPLLAVPFGTLFFGYRAYLAERERHQQLDFVHDANLALAHSQEVTRGIEALLARSLEAFRAGSAELILFGSENDSPLRTLVGPGDQRETMQPIEPAVAEQIQAMLCEGQAVVLDLHAAPPAVVRYLEARGVTNAIVAPLPGSERSLGAVVVANRLGIERGFDQPDLRLLETLAANASAALQYDRLGHAVHRLSVAQEQLQHEANHDGLTGVPTRALFLEHLRTALLIRPKQVAVLFVDLDNFKTVNDTLGHAAGDQLLVKVSSGVSGCLRGDDIVGRLGGDEFAVLIRGGPDPQGAALSVARRVLDACAIEVEGEGEGEVVKVHASVGVSLCRGRDVSAEALLQEADTAMYDAKASGKGHYQLASTPSHESCGALTPRTAGRTQTHASHDAPPVPPNPTSLNTEVLTT